VDEACSGVKTLQAAIMVALVIGELFSLSWGRRIALLVAGCGWVFACNVVRATTLVILVARHGTEALTRWHDTIGTAVLIAGMAGLVAIGWWMNASRGRQEGGGERTTTASSGDDEPAGALIQPALLVGVAPIVWLMLVFVLTELHYRYHERELVTSPPWRARWPAEAIEQPIAETTRAILRYDEASSAAWETPRGVRWWSFYARWEPTRTALQLVRSHSPEICLPAVGRTFVQELPPVVLDGQTPSLRFRAYEFLQGERPLFVFVCIQEDKHAGDGSAAALSGWNASGRLLAAWRGQRNLGQRLLEIAVIGWSDLSRAQEALEAAVNEIVEPVATKG
jgi:exosortase/archaeosortase family protein